MASRMRYFFVQPLAGIMSLLMLPASGYAANLDLWGYQREDGAITTHYQGDYVDPYFALKALLSAHELGLDITQPAETWTEWLLARANSEGLFGRYCLSVDDHWLQCETADADDALLALWVQFLHTTAPSQGMPKTWRDSARRSLLALTRLYDSRLGAYVISSSKRVALLMDNCEVLSALRVIAAKKWLWGEWREAAMLRKQADRTEKNMKRLFAPKPDGLLRHTSQEEAHTDFYPNVVAQLYPVLYGLPSLLQKPAMGYLQWMQRYRNAWLSLETDHYPWGLVALAAYRRADTDSVHCWVRSAEPLRHGARWNVLEEALLQGFVAHIKSDSPCLSR